MKSMVFVCTLALVATAVVAAPKQQTGKIVSKTNTKAAAKAKAKAGMNCPMMNKSANTAKGSGGNSAQAGGCCAGMKGGPSSGMKDMGQMQDMGRMHETSPSPSPAAPAKPAKTGALTLRAQARTTVVGANEIEIALQSGSDPVTGATVTLASAMTSMDMGTEKVTAKETAPGQYRAAVHFSMGGPWRVTVTATKDGQTGTTSLNLTAR